MNALLDAHWRNTRPPRTRHSESGGLGLQKNKPIDQPTTDVLMMNLPTSRVQLIHGLRRTFRDSFCILPIERNRQGCEVNQVFLNVFVHESLEPLGQSACLWNSCKRARQTTNSLEFRRQTLLLASVPARIICL